MGPCPPGRSRPWPNTWCGKGSAGQGCGTSSSASSRPSSGTTQTSSRASVAGPSWPSCSAPSPQCPPCRSLYSSKGPGVGGLAGGVSRPLAPIPALCCPHRFVSDQAPSGMAALCQHKLLGALEQTRLAPGTARAHPPTQLEWTAGRRRGRMALDVFTFSGDARLLPRPPQAYSGTGPAPSPFWTHFLP